MGFYLIMFIEMHKKSSKLYIRVLLAHSKAEDPFLWSK